MTRLAIGTSGMALCLLFTAAANAEVIVVEATRPVAHVQYSDINLANERGVDRLNARVRSAARRLCGEESLQLSSAMARRACLKGAIEGASAQVDLAINGFGGTRYAGSQSTITVALRR